MIRLLAAVTIAAPLLILTSCANTQTIVSRSYVSPAGAYYSNSYYQRYAGSNYQYYSNRNYYYPGYRPWTWHYGYVEPTVYSREALTTYTFSYDPYSYGPGSYVHWAGYYPSW